MRNGNLEKSHGSAWIRAVVQASLLAGSIVTVMGCTAAMESGDSGGSGSGSGGGRGGGGGGDDGNTSGGWTKLPLITDKFDPQVEVPRAGEDTVTGIYFESPDKGLIVTQGGFNTTNDGGAIFKVTHTAVTAVAYSSHDNTPNFVGLERTASGYLALSRENLLVSSSDGGATFTAQRASGSLTRVLGLRLSATGMTKVTDNGVVATTADTAPTAATRYEDIWAPRAIPSIPEQIALGDCEVGPGSILPATKASVHVSADRNFIAYVVNDGFDRPTACVSNNGGQSFQARLLDVPETGTTPSGILFISPTVGLAWGTIGVDGAYINRTSDSGRTWKRVGIPDPLAAHHLEMPVGFFAPDGEHGWLAGIDHDTLNTAVLLTTSDGGTTWTNVAGFGAAVDALHGSKLYSGFAVDATHIWLGGDAGLVIHN